MILKTDETIKRVSGGLLLANPYHDAKGKFTERFRGVPKRITTRWLKANLPNLDTDQIGEVRGRLTAVNSAARLAIVDQEEQRRAPSVPTLPREELTQETVHEYANVLNARMEELIGWETGWNGEIVDEKMFWTPGAKLTTCQIHMNGIAYSEPLHGMDILVHELTHGFSMKKVREKDEFNAGLMYDYFPEWEEGIVQGLHPILRRKMFDELRTRRPGSFGTDEEYANHDLNNSYVPLVNKMREVADLLDMPWIEFLMQMLAVPIHKRPGFALDLASARRRDGRIGSEAYGVVSEMYDEVLRRMPRPLPPKRVEREKW